ncbi:Ala-tRNA(Pro) hydrolase [Melghiribacillus thermohalophilus]|uniref:Ala-tRNA(Pro) hydrolase n=1 Tax=Melghiribacillus thermohalophilus TaxID=1324956 RepID=A0A4R3NC60_9BACI|nr:alanyl-tRNA editing protein [Melghiribacillus thermohalophilus]TCT26315.1 Ala-tRNA(Pro) hydrolase [Melghiribacillus thermohalophilus]
MTKRIYLTDCYAQAFNGTIEKIDGEKVYLDQTLFYPTGGGQEHDTGVLIQHGRECEVYKVKQEKGNVVHYVKNAEELNPGPIKGRINWDRRYGLMRHHTLLHVIGAVIYHRYEGLCTGNKIYPDRARIDFNNLPEIDDEEIADVFAEVNDIIQQNHPVTFEEVSREEAEHQSEYIKTAINLLPPHVKQVRLVRIGEVDTQACGGTHVKETREIGHAQFIKFVSKGKQNKRFELRAIRSLA